MSGPVFDHGGRPKVDISGRQFGALLCQRFVGVRKKHYYWLCLCRCGSEKILDSGHLLNGHTRSCGCEKGAMISMAKRKAGPRQRHKRPPNYTIWASMVQRCVDANSSSYSRYGAMGVTVCDRWRYGESGISGYECFASDMGARPSAAYSIDRIDTFSGYCKENCQWATRKTQSRNKRNTLYVELSGSRVPLKDACENLDLPYNTIFQRIKILGWSDHKALTTPLRGSHVGQQIIHI